MALDKNSIMNGGITTPNPSTPAGVVAPAQGLATGVNQIYTIINSIYEQMTGQADLQAVDTASLVAMGQRLYDRSMDDLFLNSLMRRIGYTIDGWRVYTNHFSTLARTNIEWGAIVQKLTVDMPEAVADMSYEVGQMDGQSIDQYIISIPKVHQRFFDKETPYSFFVTIQRFLLKEAFLDEQSMASFINQIFGKVKNKIELTLESLARLCVANFALNLENFQHFHLVSMYNTATGESLTTQTARRNPNFLRYMVGIMNTVAVKMETMNVQYNSEGFERFTPKADQIFYILADIMTDLQTVVSYAAFNQEYVTAHPDMLLPYWQANNSLTNSSAWYDMTTIEGTIEKDGNKQQKTLTNLIGLLFDREALGTFRQETDVLTTPINARGRYYNTFWHERQLWFNDMSENGVAFFLD